MQLTIFADGVNKVKPLIIFKGKGLIISAKERKAYDSQVTVQFQENAWYDENFMLFWVKNLWNTSNMFTAQKRLSRLLVYDEHRGQTIKILKTTVKSGQTAVVQIPPGTTSKIKTVGYVCQ